MASRDAELLLRGRADPIGQHLLLDRDPGRDSGLVVLPERPDPVRLDLHPVNEQHSSGFRHLFVPGRRDIEWVNLRDHNLNPS